jgi:catechol 2,3-dioxygenase-like lactoylglutathione lyase family enzyme
VHAARITYPTYLDDESACGEWGCASNQPRGLRYNCAVINGLHAVVFSPEAEKVRAFLGDVLGLPSVDAGGGWLIFAAPPAELAVHPTDGDGYRQLYLMCDDINATLAELAAKGVEIASEVSDQRWGLVAAIRLPDGTELPIYEPRHPLPPRA